MAAAARTDPRLTERIGLALAPGFDPHRLRWADPARPAEEAPA